MGSGEKRREGRRVYHPGRLSHTQDVTHAVWGQVCSALLQDFKVGLGFQEDVWVRAKELQVLTAERGFCWSGKGCVAGLGRPLAAVAIPEIAT